MFEYRVVPAGDTALLIEFDNRIDPEVNARVRMLTDAIRRERIAGVVETIPTYRSLLVCYDPVLLTGSRLERRIRKMMNSLSASDDSGSLTYVIPVCYGGQYGEDIGDVAGHAGISVEEVIRRHAAPDYLIYMLGFLPGFSYLGGMDPLLNTPRLDQPRKRIPAGSVGIGGTQTGIYPMDSPGGWRLIGRTPVKVYDAEREKILYRAGDRIRFRPVDEAEYLAIERQIAAGTWICPTEKGAVKA